MEVKKEIRKYCKCCGRYRSITQLSAFKQHGRRAKIIYFCKDTKCLKAWQTGLTGADDTK